MPKKSRSPKASRADFVLPRLPHPSWHWAVSGGQTQAPVGSAEDFWSRLGL